MNEFLKNAIVGQSGGPTCAINAELFGVISEAVSNRDKIGTLYGMKNGIEGFLKEDFVNLFSFCRLDILPPTVALNRIDSLTYTPGAFLGSCRYRLKNPTDDERDFKRIVQILKKYNIGYFFYIGGNDSMDTVAKLYDYTRVHMPSLKVIGIPKTVDNDLVLTDHTSGYGSCAKYVATSVLEIAKDRASYNTPSLTLVEIMGRETGWLTASSVLGGADLMYLPECVFSVGKFLNDVKCALENKNSIVVAVSEGIRLENGANLSECEGDDAFGNRNLFGASRILFRLTQNKIKCKCRAIELNICQRCASHIASRTDIEESILVGKMAVKYALGGESGSMVALERADDPYKITTKTVSAREVANKIKYLPKSYINSEGNGVTAEFIKYIKPLVRGEHYPKYEDGTPIHCGLDMR